MSTLLQKELAQNIVKNAKAKKKKNYTSCLQKSRIVVWLLSMKETSKERKRAPRPGEGRPSIFTQELADKICDRISKGNSLRSICKSEDMPDASTIYLWLVDKDKKEFFKQYAKAKDAQAELMFDELLEIADIGDKNDVNRARLRVDTRKWYLSKVLPKKYGDKVDLTTDGKAIEGNTLVIKDYGSSTTGS